MICIQCGLKLLPAQEDIQRLGHFHLPRAAATIQEARRPLNTTVHLRVAERARHLVRDARDDLDGTVGLGAWRQSTSHSRRSRVRTTSVAQTHRSPMHVSAHLRVRVVHGEAGDGLHVDGFGPLAAALDGLERVYQRGEDAEGLGRRTRVVLGEAAQKSGSECREGRRKGRGRARSEEECEEGEGAGRTSTWMGLREDGLGRHSDGSDLACEGAREDLKQCVEEGKACLQGNGRRFGRLCVG
jgi:hypothetical protein